MIITRLILALAAALLASPALANSTINPNTPSLRSPLSSDPIRQNFAAAYFDVNNLQSMSGGASAPANPLAGQLWRDTTSNTPQLLKIFDGAQWVTWANLNTTTHVFSFAAPNITIGSTAIVSGTTTRVLFDNAGVVGEYSVSGTGSVAMTASPTFTAPVLGAATATSINGLAITPSTGTLTIANGKTATISNTLTWSGTDGSSVALGTGGTVAYTANNLSVFASTTSAQLAGVLSDETGTGSAVFSTNAVLVTPTLGAATATSVNKVSITTPATLATLAIADGKTATISNTLTLTGTDASSVAFGTGGTVAYTENNLSVFASTTSAQLAGVLSDETGTGATVFAGSPTLTGTVTGAAMNLSGTLTFGVGTITGLTVNNAPVPNNDYLLYYNSSDGAIRKITISSLTSAGVAGVSSVNGQTGGVGIIGTSGASLAGQGIAVASASGTVTVSCLTATSSVLGCVQGDGTTLTLTSGTMSLNLARANTWTAAQTISGASFGLSGNTSAAAWTTSGVRVKNVAGTLTDTSSSGTVATAYTNVWPGNTIAASSAATFTNYFNSYYAAPAAGTNVTLTNAWALGADSAKLGTSNQFSVGTAGHVTAEGVTSTGATGTGNFVFASSPTLTTPVIGAATATTINKVSITAPATSATLTISDGKTFTSSDTFNLSTSTNQINIGSPAFTFGVISIGGATFSATFNGSGAVAYTDVAQSVSGAKTFASGALKLSGVTSGTTTFNSAAAVSGGAATITLPSATSTLLSTAGNTATLSPGNLTTTSGTLVMLGFTTAFTPTYSTRILVTVYGFSYCDLAGGIALAQVAYGTGTPPTNGAATTGTVVGTFFENTSDVANATRSFSLTNVITGLTAGTAYWLDMQAEGVSCGTANFNNLRVVVTEI